MKYAMILMVIAASTAASAQTDSLKQQLAYYPLQIGDTWEYIAYTNEASSPYPIIDSVSAFSLTVTGDSTLPDGLDYRVLLYKNLYPPHDTDVILERVDTLTGSVFSYAPLPFDSTLKNHERQIDSLYAEPSDTIGSSRGAPFAPSYWDYGTSYNSTVCKSMAMDSVLHVATEVKTFQALGPLAGENHQLGKGFGLSFEDESWDIGSTDTYLVYAKLGGVEHGQMLDAVVQHATVPSSPALFQNYPNPFNPTTVITYALPRSEFVTLRVYDILGQAVRTLVSSYKLSGTHSVTFDASSLASGVYLYSLHTGTYIATKKLLFLK